MSRYVWSGVVWLCAVLPLSVHAQILEQLIASALASHPSAQAQRALVQALGFDPCSLDALQARTGLDTPHLQAELMGLELQGWVLRLPGGLFQRQARA